MRDCKTPVTAFDLSNPQVLLAWQRNHLANERTFLAWCRTGLALFAFGFVIERFDFFIRQMQSLPMFDGLARKHLHTEAISLTTFAVGVLVIVMAGWRFAYVRRLINQGFWWPDSRRRTPPRPPCPTTRPQPTAATSWPWPPPAAVIRRTSWIFRPA